MDTVQLIKKCEVYLDFFDHYMSNTVSGQKLWNSAKPHIYIKNRYNIEVVEHIFGNILKHYLQDPGDIIDEKIDKMIVSYFMINYSVINALNICDYYAKEILDSSIFLEENPDFKYFINNNKNTNNQDSDVETLLAWTDFFLNKK